MAGWPRLERVRKIAVLRSNAIGDYIFTLPALESLRQAYPEAEIVLLGKAWHAQFLAGRPGPVDRVLVLPFIPHISEWPGGTHAPGAEEAFIKSALGEKFDICCQVYGGGRYSNPFVARLGARLTVGMKAHDAEAAGLDRWVPYLYYYPEVPRYLEVVALAGAPAVTNAPRIEATAQEMAEAKALVPENRRIAVLHPGVNDSRRHWPVERFAAVGDALAQDGCVVCISGSDHEAGLCGRLAGMMKGTPLNLCGKLPLGKLAALFSLSSVIVANDTGPMHLARAAGGRTVTVYWVGNCINAGAPNMTFHRWHISWRLNCPECGTSCIDASCSHRSSFVADVRQEPVIESALELARLQHPVEK